MKRLAVAAVVAMLAMGASAFESYMMHVPDALGAVEGTAGLKTPMSFMKGIAIPLKVGKNVVVINATPCLPGESPYGRSGIGEVKNVADGAVVSRMAEAAAKIPTVKVNMGGVTLFAIYEDYPKMYYGKLVSRGGRFTVFVALPEGREFDDEIRGILAQVEFVPPSGFGVDSALKMYGKASKLKAAAKFPTLKKMVEERAECVELIEALADAARETGHADTLAWCEAALKKLNPAVYAPDGVNSVKKYNTDDDAQSKASDELFGADSDFEKATASIPPVLEKKAERKTKTVMLPGDIPMEFIWCEKGSFTMGQNDGEFDPTKSHEPRRKVTLSKGFWLAKYETTQRQWKSVEPTVTPNFTGDDDLPVDSVSWLNCKQFAERLAEKSGIKLRLPTEAEWECACRAGTRTPYYWGNNATTKKANYNGRVGMSYADDEKNLEKTVKVGSYEPNPWGFCDMAGNVSEWCEDDWLSEPDAANAKDPLYKDDASKLKVIRGGSWQDTTKACRSADRDFEGRSKKKSYIGVRFVLDESEK